MVALVLFDFSVLLIFHAFQITLVKYINQTPECLKFPREEKKN